MRGVHKDTFDLDILIILLLIFASFLGGFFVGNLAGKEVMKAEAVEKGYAKPESEWQWLKNGGAIYREK